MTFTPVGGTIPGQEDVNDVYWQWLYRASPPQLGIGGGLMGMDYSVLLQALRQASYFQLYRLRAVIDRLLAEPECVMNVRSRLRLGQSVEYFEARHNCLHRGTIEEFRAKAVVILDANGKQRWLVEYAAINITGEDVSIRDPESQGISRHELAVGEEVCFVDPKGQEQCGKVSRLNEQTAGIDIAGRYWRVSYEFLYRKP